jgi:ATP-binding cassette subfamily C protein
MELEADGIKIKRVIEVLDKNYEDYKEEIFKLQNQIKVSDVKFSYDNSNKELCIEDIVIEKGNFIGLIGQSGEGKSTFVSLLRGNLIPKKGNISYDDISISSLKKSKYFKNQVIVASNRSFIFNDSIRANLLYAKPECTNEEMIYVCNMIGLNLNILEKKTGKNGSLLSGGEKQKLILSRIILRDFQIIFLDEATSAMDDNSNKLVRNLLDTIWIDKTRIVITHNKDIITNATCIYTIDNGVISQMKRGRNNEKVENRLGNYC